jgi:hypothetical protein
LTTLGADVFRNCKIVEAVIPASVTSIGYKPYPHAETYNVSPDNSHFSSLSGILYTRDQQTLIDCPSRNPLSSLTIGPNVRTISDNAFSPSRLETIAIPDNVTNVGTGILAWCGLLKNVTLGAGMGEIPARMFQSSGLESITLPANITVTGAGAFRNCGSLEIVSLSDGITRIEEFAFSGCRDLETMTLPGSVTVVGDECFSNCGRLVSIELSANLISIGGHAFGNCAALARINLPDNVTTLGDGVFSSCYDLRVANLGTRLVSIPAEAFAQCGNLSTVTIPETVISISSGAFNFCRSLTSISLPSGLIEIGENAFNRSESLTTLSIPPLVNSIGESAFLWSGLESLIFEDSPTAIQDLAFSNCFHLTTVSLGGRVTEIGDSSFLGCTQLQSVTVPDSVSSMGVGAFTNCQALEVVSLGGGLETPLSLRFGRCPSLRHIEVSPENSIYRSIDGAVYTKDGRTLLCVPQSYPGPDFFAFQDLREIGARAFDQNTTLGRVHLPSGLSLISDKAFQNISAPLKVYFTGSAPTIGLAIFEDSSDEIVIAISPASQGFGATFEGRTVVMETFEIPPPVLQPPFVEGGVLVIPFRYSGLGSNLTLYNSSDLVTWIPVNEVMVDGQNFRVPFSGQVLLEKGFFQAGAIEPQ